MKFYFPEVDLAWKFEVFMSFQKLKRGNNKNQLPEKYRWQKYKNKSEADRGDARRNKHKWLFREMGMIFYLEFKCPFESKNISKKTETTSSIIHLTPRNPVTSLVCSICFSKWTEFSFGLGPDSLLHWGKGWRAFTLSARPSVLDNGQKLWSHSYQVQFYDNVGSTLRNTLSVRGDKYFPDTWTLIWH